MPSTGASRRTARCSAAGRRRSPTSVQGLVDGADLIRALPERRGAGRGAAARAGARSCRTRTSLRGSPRSKRNGGSSISTSSASGSSPRARSVSGRSGSTTARTGAITGDKTSPADPIAGRRRAATLLARQGGRRRSGRRDGVVAAVGSAVARMGSRLRRSPIGSTTGRWRSSISSRRGPAGGRSADIHGTQRR